MLAPGRKNLHGLRRHPLAGAAVLVLVVILLLLDYLVDEPFRRWLVTESNERLVGYTLELPEADLKPWSFSVIVRHLTVRQDANPRPPVGQLARGFVGIDWRALLRGRIVADVQLDQPVLFLDSVQAATEDADAIEFEDRGWRRLLELYPLKVNALRVTRGALRYRDVDSGRTLVLDDVEATAGNIRHVSGGRTPYPSPFRLAATVFGRGKLVFEGHADFLMEPHAAVYGVATLADAPLDAFGPVIEDYRFRLKGGLLGFRGQVEVRPELYIANLKHVTVDGLRLDFVAGQQSEAGRRAVRAVASAARKADTSPAIRLRMQTLRITGNIGFLSATTPQYRLFLDRANLTLTNFSNRAAQGDAQLALDGLLMGSGRTRVRGTLTPGPGPARFAVDARVIDAQLPAFNDLLRSHGRLDVSEGWVSVYSQLYARDGQLRGYVKPLFRDVDVLAPEDEDEPALKRLYEFIVERVARLLENEPRDEVASVADLSGDLTDPDVSAWQVVGNLLKNAFIEAILPGFDQERARKSSARKTPD